MKCGLHYVRFCDLRTKRCTGAPACQVATQAIADALAGGPLTRRKVHAFAKHPSRSRPGAPGTRLPSDRLVLDPSVLRPPGPAAPQAREQDPGPEDPMAHGATGPARQAQDEAHGEPGAAAGDPAPVVAREQRPGGADHEDGRDERPQGIRAFPGLRPCGVEPGGITEFAIGADKARKTVKPKAKPAPGGLSGRRARKPRALPELSSDPRGYIHRWLTRGVTGGSTGQDGTPELLSGPQVRSPGNCQPGAGYGTEQQAGSRCLPEAPGSSTDPPPGGLWPGPHRIPTPTPGDQGVGQGGQRAARRVCLVWDRGNRRRQGSRALSPPWEAGASPMAAVFSEDEDTSPRVSRIPDLFVPIPRGGGRQVPPRPGVRGAGQLEPD